MSMRRKSPWRPGRPSNAADMQPPKYLAGDPVRTRDGKQGIVGHLRRDGLVHVAFKDGTHDFIHQDDLSFDTGFAPVRRR